MERTPRVFFFLFAFPLFFIGVTSLGRAAYSFHKDWHWTPGLRPLNEDKGRFEVYVRGEPLERALGNGQIAARDGQSWAPLSSSDVTVRYNQIDRVTRSPLLIGVGCLSAGFAWLFAVFVLRRSRPAP